MNHLLLHCAQTQHFIFEIAQTIKHLPRNWDVIGSSVMAVPVTITRKYTPPYLMGARCSLSGDKLAGPQSSLLFFK